MVTFWWKRIFQFTFVTISFNFFVRYIFVSILFGTFNPFCETGNLKNRERKENYAKFTYSEKATKFCEISTVNLTIQIHSGDFAKFVVFSEYMNFKGCLKCSFFLWLTHGWNCVKQIDLELARTLEKY